jgi:hypothetical protein
MKNGLMLTIALVCLSASARASDPTSTDGDKYKVLLENEKVRVLAYSDQPGQKTQQHLHPTFVVYAVAPFKRRLTLSDGRTLTREFKAGDVLYSNGEAHIGENIGDTPTQVIMVEIKGAKAVPSAGAD